MRHLSGGIYNALLEKVFEVFNTIENAPADPHKRGSVLAQTTRNRQRPGRGAQNPGSFLCRK